ncbi:MAG: hypothetical protein ACI8WB_004711, partial [Phenylobacterium sp.]
MKAKIVLAENFLTAMLKLPRQQHKEVTQFVNKFRHNPNSNDIGYKKITDAANPDMRAVNIAQVYRAVILKPAQEGVFILLWVGHHDAVDDWAKHHQCRIHPSTGAIQLYSTAMANKVAAVPLSEQTSAPLFDSYSDQQLTDIGLPLECLTRVRDIHSMAAFSQLSGLLPDDAFEALHFIAVDIPYDEVLADYRSINGSEGLTGLVSD